MSTTIKQLPVIDFFETVLGITNLSPIQRVTLKVIRCEPLDEASPVIREHTYQERDFASELEMFLHFSGKDSYHMQHYSDASLAYGRRGGKCLAEGTEVLTPHGPKKIESMNPGDTVYGFNSDGSVSETKVQRVHDNGIKEVIQLINSNQIIAESTLEHVWATINEWQDRNKRTVYGERKVSEFYSKNQYVRRSFVKIPCGNVTQPHAYAIGALLGDGGRRENHVGGYISAATPHVPEKVSRVLGTPVTKNHHSNYTYYVHQLKRKCNLYNEWMGERYAHEKLADWSIIDSWDRNTCLEFMAGLLDTDGSVHMSKDTASLNIGFGCQAFPVVEAFQKLFFKLWQHNLNIRKDIHKDYKNGPVYYVNCKSNLYSKIALKELDPYLVSPSRKWKSNYSDLPEQRKHDRLGVKLGNKRWCKTYDLEVNNDTHLYLLANEGLVTHNSTTIGAGLALYYATQFDYLPYLGTSPHATIPIISATKEQAGEVFAAIKNFCLRSPWIFSKFLDGNVENIQTEYSEDDLKNSGSIKGGSIKLNNKVVIKVMAADISKIRGMAVPFAIMDENCFFGVEGNDTKNTDKGIYEALAPALSQFQEVEGMALVLKISSPNGQAGLQFNDYMNRKDPDTLHMQVPSWWANPKLGVKYLEKQKKKGLNYFNREYGAQYTASETAYLDPNAIERSIIRGVEELEFQKGYRYVAWTDYATRNDLWTLAIGHKEFVINGATREREEKVYIDCLAHWQGADGAELNPESVIAEIAVYLRKYQVPFCVSDQYAFAAIRPFFEREGFALKEYTLSNTSKIKMMYSLQVALNSSQMLMVHNTIAVQHLKDLREKRSNIANKVQIEAAGNSHDDYAIAVSGVIFMFDKSCPLYVGYYVDDEEEEASSSKDVLGRYLSTPTAADVAEKTGLMGFYDNRREVEEREKAKDRNEEDEDGSFWFVFSD